MAGGSVRYHDSTRTPLPLRSIQKFVMNKSIPSALDARVGLEVEKGKEEEEEGLGLGLGLG